MQADNAGQFVMTGWNSESENPDGNTGTPPAHSPAPQTPDAGTPDARTPDAFLVDSMLAGDAAALRTLIDRYDRLVRFTIFKVNASQCRADPQWLDGIASDTWNGFVQSLQRNPDAMPDNLKAYLSRIARNRAISAGRGKNLPTNSLDDHETMAEQLAGSVDQPADQLADLEMLSALKNCLADLDEDARQMADHLESITQRRWKQAAESLGCAESTLRSRWKVVLGLLRDCVSGKTGVFIAPDRKESDC